MKEQLSLTVKTRSAFGKGANRKLRAKDLVPGIYYDAKGANIPVIVNEMPLLKLIKAAGSSHVFELNIESDSAQDKRPSLIWKLQRHPYKSKLTHVDFYGVDMDKQIKVHIPVEFTGKAKGIVLGGRLEIFTEQVEIQCLPAAIPDKVVIDVTDLGLNSNIHIADMVFPDGVKAVYENNYAVVGVVTLAEEETAGEGESAEAEA